VATNGLVSIVVGGKVAMKIVTGSDGYNAALLAQLLRAIKRVPSVQEAVDFCVSCEFGASRSDYGSLCIQTPERDHYLSDPEAELPPLYREKFSDPRFNPRWKCGIAAYTEVIEMEGVNRG
jgi:hypothetical protein